MCPAKTQISLGIHPFWSESSLSAWRITGSLATHKTHSEYWHSDQTGQMLRLNWVFAWRIAILLVLSCCSGSYLSRVPSEDSDQPAHRSSLIKFFDVRMKKAWVLSYPLIAQQRLWSDREDAQPDLSLRWAHRSFRWFRHEVAHLVKTRLRRVILMNFCKTFKTDQQILVRPLKKSIGHIGQSTSSLVATGNTMHTYVWSYLS